MSAIDTAAVDKASKALAEAYTALAKAESDYATVKCLNGQNGYSVTVNGVRVDVAVMDGRTYMGTMIRGREMIHLGALKALQSIIRSCKERVIEREKTLASIAGGAA